MDLDIMREMKFGPERDRLIRQTRLESDLIALELDKPISEERRLEIVGLLERKYVKIKMLKGE